MHGLSSSSIPQLYVWASLLSWSTTEPSSCLKTGTLLACFTLVPISQLFTTLYSWAGLMGATTNVQQIRQVVDSCRALPGFCISLAVRTNVTAACPSCIPDNYTSADTLSHQAIAHCCQQALPHAAGQAICAATVGTFSTQSVKPPRTF